MKTYKTFGTKVTPQSKPIPGKDQVKNSAGGYVYSLDNWKRLDRFLILGSEGGTYYIKQDKLTKDNALNLLDLIKEDGKRVVARIVEVSEDGLAPKNDPALFALAAAISVGDYDTRRAAADVLPRVARIGTHLFHFASYMQQFRGWGQIATRAVSNWYLDKPEDKLSYQLIKYQQRDKWSHRDLLRLSHPKPKTETQDSMFHWVTQGSLKEASVELIDAFERAKVATKASDIVKLIEEYNLPREVIPTELLNDTYVWEALLQKMPITATIRNLGRMTSNGLLTEMNDSTSLVTKRITNQKTLIRGRVHPLVLLNALNVYEKGKGFRSEWKPLRRIVDALDDAFYLSFDAVKPSGKRLMLALDVSSSMSWNEMAGMALTPRDASAALSLVTANVEENYMITGFQTKLTPLSISPKQRVSDAIRRVSDLQFGGTDCAQPMKYALENGLEFDAFYVYTDSETWAGRSHPSQALVEYRQKTGINAKLIVVGMESNGFTIADPNDPGMLDVVGFDTTVPNIMTEFVSEVSSGTP